MPTPDDYLREAEDFYAEAKMEYGAAERVAAAVHRQTLERDAAAKRRAAKLRRARADSLIARATTATHLAIALDTSNSVAMQREFLARAQPERIRDTDDDTEQGPDDLYRPGRTVVRDGVTYMVVRVGDVTMWVASDGFVYFAGSGPEAAGEVDRRQGRHLVVRA